MGRARFAFGVLAFGYAFLYLPIALVIVYSFNESRLVTVWSGFSFKWWQALFANEAMLSAAWLSLRIAFVSATIAAAIGLAAGYALVRARRFPGRTLFGSLVVRSIALISRMTWFWAAERPAILIARKSGCVALFSGWSAPFSMIPSSSASS